MLNINFTSDKQSGKTGRTATMYYGNIKYNDIANGVGVRTTLFVSGCTHHCKGCFQTQTWCFSFGEPFTDEIARQIIDSLHDPWIDGLTLLGGEPMEPSNQEALLPFVKQVRDAVPEKTIWMYTGDIYEDLTDPASPRHTQYTDELLSLINVLVDGPFMQERKDITLRFRGSSNQRIIDLAATRAAGKVVLWHDDPQYETHTM